MLTSAVVSVSFCSMKNAINRGIFRNAVPRFSPNTNMHQFIKFDCCRSFGLFESTKLLSPSTPIFNVEKTFLLILCVVITFVSKCDGVLKTWSPHYSMPVRHKIKISKWEMMEKKANPKIENMNFQTNVLNNVLLFKYDKEKMFFYMNAFAFVQAFTLLTVASNLYLIYREDIHKKYKSRWEAFKNKILSVGVISMLCVLGPLICLGLWFISSRMVRFIILNKGGTKITMGTYHPLFYFGKQASLVLPLEKVQCVSSRYEKKTVMYLKVKGRKLFYIMDGTGEFPNPGLFDTTVGVVREF